MWFYQHKLFWKQCSPSLIRLGRILPLYCPHSTCKKTRPISCCKRKAMINIFVSASSQQIRSLPVVTSRQGLIYFAPLRASPAFNPEELELYRTKGWDGENAVAVESKTIKLVHDLLDSRASQRFLRETSAGADGSVAFVWEDDQDNYVYCSIGPSDVIHLYYTLQDGLKWEGLVRADHDKISDHIAMALEFTRRNGVRKSVERVFIPEPIAA